MRTTVVASYVKAGGGEKVSQSGNDAESFQLRVPKIEKLSRIDLSKGYLPRQAVLKRPAMIPTNHQAGSVVIDIADYSGS